MGNEAKDESVHLIEKMAAGEREAFGRFYDRFAPLVFSLAMRLLRERSAAEDLLQEVFIQAWSQAKNYSRERGSPEAWIITMTRSRGIDKLRSRRRRDRSFVSNDNPSGPEYAAKVTSGMVESEARLTVHGALAQLPETERAVLELAYFDGLTQSEIAARLGQPLGTVKTRMRAGMERLRAFFGAKAGGEFS